MSIDPYAYSVVIKRVNFCDGIIYEATALELPDMLEIGTSPNDVYALAIDTIKTAAKDFQENGRQFPQCFNRQGVEND